MHDLAELAFRHRSVLLLVPVAPIIVWATQSAAPTGGELTLVVLGCALALLGGGLRGWAVRAIGKRARVRHAGAKELLVAGPYARVRNPLYVANAAIIAGLALAAGGGAWTLLVVAATFGVYALVVHHEEAQLATLFGTDYDAYRALVPRWWPLLRAATSDEVVPWSWAHVLRREAGLILGLPLALVGIGLERQGALPQIDWTLAWIGDAIDLAPGGVVLVLVAVTGAIHTAVELAKRVRHEEARAAYAQAEARAGTLGLERGAPETAEPPGAPGADA
jgi:protein-S-isoprenylcysteine O-methyltransferase Ste14